MEKVFSTYLSKFLICAGRSPQCCHPAVAKHWDNINLGFNCWSWARTALLHFRDPSVRNQLTGEYKYKVCFLLALWWLLQSWLWAAAMGGGTEQWGKQKWKTRGKLVLIFPVDILGISAGNEGFCSSSWFPTLSQAALLFKNLFLVFSQCSLFSPPLFACLSGAATRLLYWHITCHTTVQLCTEEHLHIQKGTWKDSRKTWSPRNALLVCSQAITWIRPIRTCLEFTGTGGNKNIQLLRKSSLSKPLWVLSQLSHQPRCPGMKTITGCHGEQFCKSSFTLRGVAALGLDTL